MTQEQVAQSISVSWMPVHRWEHELRTIMEDKLEQISKLDSRSVRWFMTIEVGGLDLPDPSTDTARRIYRRVSNAPEKYYIMVENVIDEMIAGLK